MSTARLIHSRRPACGAITMFMNSTLPSPAVGRLSVPAGRAHRRYPDQVRFGLLGTVAVWADNGRLAAVPEAKVRAVLAVLLIHLGQPVPADRLIDDLWGDDLPVHPAGALQVKVSRLRQALENAEPGGGHLVAFRSPGYLLQAGSDALDECRFAALVERAARAGICGNGPGCWPMRWPCGEARRWRTSPTPCSLGQRSRG